MSNRLIRVLAGICLFIMTFYPGLVKVMTWVCHMFYWSSHSKYPKTRLSDLSCSIMLIAAIIYIYFKWGESSFQKITQKTKTKCTNFYIQINSQKKSARNARISCVHGPGFWPIFDRYFRDWTGWNELDPLFNKSEMFGKMRDEFFINSYFQ